MSKLRRVRDVLLTGLAGIGVILGALFVFAVGCAIVDDIERRGGLWADKHPPVEGRHEAAQERSK